MNEVCKENQKFCILKNETLWKIKLTRSYRIGRGIRIGIFCWLCSFHLGCFAVHRAKTKHDPDSQMDPQFSFAKSGKHRASLRAFWRILDSPPSYPILPGHSPNHIIHIWVDVDKWHTPCGYGEGMRRFLAYNLQHKRNCTP